MMFNGVTFDASFSSRVNFLRGNSGTGKTFLLKALELYCNNNDISCQYLDYRARHKSLEYISTLCGDADVLLLDNADLYLTPEIFNKLRSSGKFMVISMKDISELDLEGVKGYVVKYSNTQLVLKRA